jgi:hypothetical protein
MVERAPKACKVCGEDFIPRSVSHRYCGDACRAQWHRITFQSTEYQYRTISGDWHRYFVRLCNSKERKGVITPQDCIEILNQQQGRCALSGETLTCRLERGTLQPTNASLDRKNPGGSYRPENIQLVCVVLNSFRGATPLNEFISWCKKVAANG